MKDQQKRLQLEELALKSFTTSPKDIRGMGCGVNTIANDCTGTVRNGIC